MLPAAAERSTGYRQMQGKAQAVALMLCGVLGFFGSNWAGPMFGPDSAF